MSLSEIKQNAAKLEEDILQLRKLVGSIGILDKTAIEIAVVRHKLEKDAPDLTDIRWRCVNIDLAVYYLKREKLFDSKLINDIVIEAMDLKQDIEDLIEEDR
jgi:hypothetical protein